MDEAARDAGAQQPGGAGIGDRGGVSPNIGWWSATGLVGRLSRVLSTASPGSCRIPAVVAVTVAERETRELHPVPEVGGEVPGLLSCPCRGRVGGDAGEVRAPNAVFEEHQDVEPCAECGAEVEEAAAMVLWVRFPRQPEAVVAWIGLVMREWWSVRPGPCARRLRTRPG